MRRTKIIATLGPATSTPAALDGTDRPGRECLSLQHVPRAARLGAQRRQVDPRNLRETQPRGRAAARHAGPRHPHRRRGQDLRSPGRRLGQLHRPRPKGHGADQRPMCNYPYLVEDIDVGQHRHRRQRPAPHAGHREAPQRTRLRGAHARPAGQPPPHQSARRRRQAARADRKGLRRHRARLRVQDGFHRHVVRPPRRRHRAPARRRSRRRTAASASSPRSRTRSRSRTWRKSSPPATA